MQTRIEKLEQEIARSNMIRRSLYQRLEWLEARVQADRTVPGYRVLFIGGGIPGELATVIGLDGRMVWWNSPVGSELPHLEITFPGNEGSDNGAGARRPSDLIASTRGR
jgi:hypothetical protein